MGYSREAPAFAEPSADYSRGGPNPRENGRTLDCRRSSSCARCGDVPARPDHTLSMRRGRAEIIGSVRPPPGECPAGTNRPTGIALPGRPDRWRTGRLRDLAWRADDEPA